MGSALARQRSLFADDTRHARDKQRGEQPSAHDFDEAEQPEKSGPCPPPAPRRLRGRIRGPCAILPKLEHRHGVFQGVCYAHELLLIRWGLMVLLEVEVGFFVNGGHRATR